MAAGTEPKLKHIVETELILTHGKVLVEMENSGCTSMFRDDKVRGGRCKIHKRSGGGALAHQSSFLRVVYQRQGTSHESISRGLLRGGRGVAVERGRREGSELCVES